MYSENKTMSTYPCQPLPDCLTCICKHNFAFLTQCEPCCLRCKQLVQKRVRKRGKSTSSQLEYKHQILKILVSPTVIPESKVEGGETVQAKDMQACSWVVANSFNLHHHCKEHLEVVQNYCEDLPKTLFKQPGLAHRELQRRSSWRGESN